MSILKNTVRNGAFTSSEIVKLTTLSTSKKDFGAPAKTYIEETNIERYLDDAIDGDVDSKPTYWGSMVEPRVHELLSTEYEYTSDITNVHPEIPYWVGSADGFRNNIDKSLRAAIDIKCPMTKKSFVKLVLPLYLGLTGMEVIYAIRDGFNHKGTEYSKHTDGAKYYWQIVSNAIINGCNWGELIVYMPFQSELLEINNSCMEDQQRWLQYNAGAIPFLKDGGFFNNINVIRFKIPQEDKDFLTAQVLKAGEMLISPSEILMPSIKQTA